MSGETEDPDRRRPFVHDDPEAREADDAARRAMREIDERLRQKKGEAFEPPNGLNRPEAEDTSSSMEERIGRLGGAMEGVRHGQNLVLGGLGLVVTLMIGFGVYSLQRIDSLTDKVNALPGEISTDLRDITKTLAESITAARSVQQTPVIVVQPHTPQTSPAPPGK